MINDMINGISEYAHLGDIRFNSRNSLVPVKYFGGILLDKRNKGVLLLIDYIVNLYFVSLHIMNFSFPSGLMRKFNGMFPQVI